MSIMVRIEGQYGFLPWNWRLCCCFCKKIRSSDRSWYSDDNQKDYASLSQSKDYGQIFNHPPCENVQEIAMRSRSYVHASLVSSLIWSIDSNFPFYYLLCLLKWNDFYHYNYFIMFIGRGFGPYFRLWRCCVDLGIDPIQNHSKDSRCISCWIWWRRGTYWGRNRPCNCNSSS